MTKEIIRFYFICVVMMMEMLVNAQDISSIKSAPPIRTSGSFFGSTNYVDSEDKVNSPFGYNAGLNINFNFYNALNIPLNFSYSSYGTSFQTLSFNRFGISPSYKSIKLHAGHRSYLLSPYLMSGMTVLGGGIELTPRNFYFLAFYGKGSDPYTYSNEFLEFKNQQIALYDRNIYGFKMGFGKPQNRINISIFHAKDNENSGSIDTLVKYNINPKENFGLAVDASQTIFKNLTLSGNAATSIVTNDIYGSEIEDSNATKWIEKFSFLTKINGTTRYAFAYDAKMSLRINSFNVGFKYQHIDPFYTSFGVVFLQNNFDNYLIDMGGTLFKGRLSLFSSVGMQYLHSSGFTGLPQKRVVANVNAAFKISKALYLNSNYSNLVQNGTPKVEEVLDSLAITTNNVGWSGTLNIKPGSGKERPHVFSLSASSNTFDVLNQDTITLSNTNDNFSLNYKYNVKNSWSFGGGVLYNIGKSTLVSNVKRYGLLLNAGKTLSEGLQLRLNASYRLNETSNTSDGYVINMGSSLTYNYKKAHHFILNASHLSRKTSILAAKNESRFRISYTYNF